MGCVHSTLLVRSSCAWSPACLVRSRCRLNSCDVQVGEAVAGRPPAEAGAKGAGIACEPPDLEQLRLEATRAVRALDAPAEARFHTITSLLQGVFKVPIAVVGLIESDYLALVAKSGTSATRCRRVHSFCDASLKLPHPTMMVVEDTLQDARFQHAELVEEAPHVRFYSGAPLISSEGYVLGSLGIMDLVPRRFPADQYNMICNFAELVVRDLERDKAEELQRQRSAQLAQRQVSLVRALSCFHEGIILCDMARDWRIAYTNEAWDRLTGISQVASLQTPFWDLLELAEPKPWGVATAEAQAAISKLQPFSLRLAPRRAPGGALQLTFRPATGDHIGEHIPLIGIPNFVESEPANGAGGRDGSAVYYFAVAQEAPPAAPSTPTSPRDVFSVLGSDSSSLSAPRCSTTSYGGSIHSCFGLDHPAMLQELKLGPLLGKGSFGRVYRGLWRGARVAVKILDTWVDPAPEGADGAGAAPCKGPLLEALLSRELPHPHIVQTYEFDSRMEQGSIAEEEGEDRQASDALDEQARRPRQLQRLWIVQQYCNRGTLYDAIDRGWLRTRRDLSGPTNLLAVLQTAQEIASALSYLHSRGIVHGDLTGANVLLNSSTKDARRFTALVGDFGLARVLTGDTPLETASVGTVSHMPPEALADGIVTKAADVFSFGVLLWELICHRRAWCGLRASQVVYHVASMGQTLQLPPDTPPAYKALAEACMHSDRAKRPTFDEVLDTLDAMLLEVGQAGTAT